MTDPQPPPPVDPTPLLDHVLAAVGQDPLLLGASGYADDVFPLRLVGDST